MNTKLKTGFKLYRSTSTYFRKVRRATKKICDNSKLKTKVPLMLDAESCTLQEEVSSVTNVLLPESSNSEELSNDNRLDEDDSLFCYDCAPNRIQQRYIFDKNEENHIDDRLCLLEELRRWALTNRVPHSTVDDILKILTSHGLSELPRNSRTLLKTPVLCTITRMGTGEYWYNGIKTSLQTALCDIENPTSISILINIDGISPYNNSAFEFWPILFMIDKMPHLKPMVASLYYGRGKPPLDPYLSPFVDELKEVLDHGVHVNGHKVSVKIKCFVCDTPARSFIKGVVSFNAHHGCIKCTVVGEWDKHGKHMSFPRTHCPRRTDQGFRMRTDEEHHKEITPLLKLPINLVEDVIIADSLHLFDLGF